MSAPPAANDAEGSASRRLVTRLRAALVPSLIDGSWSQIEENHRKVGLQWRPEFGPGWGKPKYVERVLAELVDEEVVALARRVLEQFADRRDFALEDLLLWFDAGGVSHVSEVTRLNLARALERHRLHPSESPDAVLGRFARTAGSERFEYAEDGSVCTVSVDILSLFDPRLPTRSTVTLSSHLALLDAYGFREWPDARLFQLLEFLAHPTVLQGDEQAALVHAINGVLAADRFHLTEDAHLSGHPVFKVRPSRGGVAGRPKNLIFASTGPKPELGFVDAVNNDIAILRHAEHCLVYEEPIGDAGLLWSKLVEWWASREGLEASNPTARKGLGDRLARSLASEPERRLFSGYFKSCRQRLGDALPALVPQVYLHFDPMTLRALRARGEQRRFDMQRMDFLMLLPHGVRIVIEIDGQQHYATGADGSARPSPEEYARTVRGDRELRLNGYEVYRFGGYELHDEASCPAIVEAFFGRLFRRHSILDLA